jgi:hypothetical protein
VRRTGFIRRKGHAELRTVNQFYRVDRHRVNLIKFIFEAYEGLALVTTIDPVQGIIVLRVAPGCEAIAESVLKDLSQRFAIEPIPPVVVNTEERIA